MKWIVFILSVAAEEIFSDTNTVLLEYFFETGVFRVTRNIPSNYSFYTAPRNWIVG